MNGFEILPSSSGGSDPLKLDLAGGTMTGQLVLTAAADGALKLTPTWNNAGVDFAGIYLRATNTASGASSKLLDLGTVAGGSKLSLTPAGALVGNADASFTGNLFDFQINGSSQASLNYYGLFSTTYVQAYGYVKTWGPVVIGGSNEVFLWHDGNGKLRLQGQGAIDPFYEIQLGNPHATTPTNSTIKAHDVTTGTGADLILKGGTGSVANGNVSFGVHSAVGAESVTGFITIKDEAGNLRKLAVLS